ncbi:MAG: alanine racemase [Cyanobacteria bacterium J06638_22]
MLNWEKTPSLKPMLRERAWVEVDLGALAHNVRQVRQRLHPTTDLMAVVKADAYGHGAIAIAQTALRCGASWLGVATIPEGMELRSAGIQAPILVLGAVNAPEQVEAIAHWNLQPTLCNPKQALIFSDTLEKMAIAAPLPVHLMVDTGMSRLGTGWEDATEFVQWVQRLPHLTIASVYSHLATADDPEPSMMQLQHQRFEQAIAHLHAVGITPPRLHLANSAATLLDPNLHYDMVRTGLILYGLHPAPHLMPYIDLQPVLQVKARVTQVKPLTAGSGVSYGHSFVAPHDLTLAVIGIGYADGIPRLLSNRLSVLIRGQRVPQVGAVTMDQMMLDVSTIPDLQPGEIVTLLGQDGNETITADDWANTLGTISWEILCSFKHRLPRLTVNAPQEASAVIGG